MIQQLSSALALIIPVALLVARSASSARAIQLGPDTLFKHVLNYSDLIGSTVFRHVLV